MKTPIKSASFYWSEEKVKIDVQYDDGRSLGLDKSFDPANGTISKHAVLKTTDIEDVLDKLKSHFHSLKREMSK